VANILATLGTAADSLGVFSTALTVVQNNISNATTPGYARQRLALQALSFIEGGGQVGGVDISRIESVRDRFLDFQVIASLQAKRYFEKFAQTLAQVEPAFPLSGEWSVGATVDAFFNSLSALSVSPADFNLREAVLESARTTANAIRATHRSLLTQRANLDQEARAAVDGINSLAAEIAALNTPEGQAGVKAGNTATETRLSQLMEELGTLIDYTIVRQQDGAMSLVVGSAAIVSGSRSFPLLAFPSEPRLEVRDSLGNDITPHIQGGQLGAMLAARNNNITAYIKELNQLAGTLADAVNGQLAAGRDLAGLPGQPIFQYTSLAFAGAGRTPGTIGALTPVPPVSVNLTFSGGLTGSITALLDSFQVAAAPPAGLASGDTITVNFTSADGLARPSITTAPLAATDTTAIIATRLNDQVALNAALAGKVSFIDQGGNLKVVLSDTVGQGFSFTASTSNPGFTSGLESGGTLGGHSAQEIAAALNAQVALDANLSAAGVRFTAAGGQVRLDANVSFTFTGTDFPSGTGFVSGLAGVFTAGGSPAASTFAVTGLASRKIAASSPAGPNGNENALALVRLSSQPLVGGFTFNQFYSRLIAEVGEDARQAETSFQTQTQILLEAQNMRDALSGVSLDEEAAQLVQFQKAYEATARVITVLDSLADEIMNLVR